MGFYSKRQTPKELADFSIASREALALERPGTPSLLMPGNGEEGYSTTVVFLCLRREENGCSIRLAYLNAPRLAYLLVTLLYLAEIC